MATSALGGPYTDDLSKCLVESTTAQDRADLVKWMFAAASAHPTVRPLSAVTDEQLQAANKQMGELLTRLLTKSCAVQAKKALKFEGTDTFQASFQVLGQVAGRELFGSPEVAKTLGGLEEYIDTDALKALANDEQ